MTVRETGKEEKSTERGVIKATAAGRGELNAPVPVGGEE